MEHKFLPLRVKACKEEIIESYNSFAQVYAEVTPWEKEAHQAVIAKADIKEGYRVLDAGCGPGTILIKAGEQVGGGGRVYGIDLSPKMLQQARKGVESKGMGDRIQLIKADIHYPLPFSDDSFDIVISTYVFDLIDTPYISKVLRHLVQVLKPGGKMVLANWTFGEGEHKVSSDIYAEVYQNIKVKFGCRPVYLMPFMEKIGLRNLGREYISYDMPPEAIKALFGSLAKELRSAPEIEKKVRGLHHFVFCSEVVWGTR